VRAWRARILFWSGLLAEAEQEFLKILSVSRNDPDNWMGLADIYLREGRTADARDAMDKAVKLDASRADLRAARGRVLRTAGERNEVRTEFQNALNLDSSSEIQAQLRTSGYEALRCDQPEQATNLAPELLPDVITQDLLMKPVHGLDALKRLKNDPRTSMIPVIILTIGDQAFIGTAFDAEEYLIKPVEKPTLLAAV
jgi:CheY-like chemotaxis protein